MISRYHHMLDLQKALKRSRVTVLVGPRQCGKTTLARQFVAPDSPAYFDLEDPVSLARLEEPMTALGALNGIVVIDEVQRKPELFPMLRVLADRNPLPARFLVLGSAAPDLLRQSSESLAGRMELLQISGFSLPEVGTENHAVHWLRGGFPLSFLAASDEDSLVWRKKFLLQRWWKGTYPCWAWPSLRPPCSGFGPCWPITTGKPGMPLSQPGLWGSAKPTTRRYLDLLEGLYMVRQLRPWHANLKKRQVKAPKIYLRDSGLLHSLLGIRTEADLLNHPKCGASWEGYVIEESIRAARPDEACFWATHNGAEIDLLLFKNGRKIGVECKRMDAPRMTPSIRHALDDLQLERVLIAHPGTRRYRLSEQVEAVPFVELLLELQEAA